MTENVQHSRHIADTVGIPVHTDGDTGFGNAKNIFYTVERLEEAGVASDMLEDLE